MNNSDQETMKTIIHSVLDERKSVDEETHKIDHVYVRELRERSRRRALMVDKIKTQVGGWFVIVLIMAVGSAVWQWVMHLIHTKSGGG